MLQKKVRTRWDLQQAQLSHDATEVLSTTAEELNNVGTVWSSKHDKIQVDFLYAYVYQQIYQLVWEIISQ